MMWPEMEAGVGPAGLHVTRAEEGGEQWKITGRRGTLDVRFGKIILVALQRIRIGRARGRGISEGTLVLIQARGVEGLMQGSEAAGGQVDGPVRDAAAEVSNCLQRCLDCERGDGSLSQTLPPGSSLAKPAPGSPACFGPSLVPAASCSAVPRAFLD